MSGFTSMLNPSASAGGGATTKKVTHAQANTNPIYEAHATALRKAAGLSSFVIPKLHDISPPPGKRFNATGVQAQLQGNPAQEDGSVQVGAQSLGDQALAVGACALIDIATVSAELRKAEPTRRYLGASSIGSSCMAYLTLSLRGFPGDTPSPQLLRIFGDGHRIERLVVEALTAAGHKVEELDPATGKQWQYTSHGGHHSGSLDGFITLVGSQERMTLEIKSMNRKLFESFQKKGVALSHPKYYDQMQDGLLLARAAKVKVAKCFIVAYCKDNSMFHGEVVSYNEDWAVALLHKVSDVIDHKAPMRSGSYAQEFQCKGCGKRTSCWEPNVTDRGCHHCAHAQPYTGAQGKRWTCAIDQTEATAVCSSFKLFRVEKHV